MKYSDRQLAGLSARPPDRVELIGAGSLLSRLRDRPQLRLRADKLPSPNHCERRDFLLVFKNLSFRIVNRQQKKNIAETERRPLGDDTHTTDPHSHTDRD